MRGAGRIIHTLGELADAALVVGGVETLMEELLMSQLGSEQGKELQDGVGLLFRLTFKSLKLLFLNVFP